MNKIEVRRVPDEQLIHLKHNLPDGAIVLHGDNRTRRVIMPDEQPALLAALLEQAGAVKVEIKRQEGVAGRIKGLPANINIGPAWLLPIQEEGE